MATIGISYRGQFTKRDIPIIHTHIYIYIRNPEMHLQEISSLFHGMDIPISEDIKMLTVYWVSFTSWNRCG